MDLETVKASLWVAYTKLAQFLLSVHLLLYGIACIAAGQPLGPAKYAAFLYRIFTFR